MVEESVLRITITELESAERAEWSADFAAGYLESITTKAGYFMSL